MDGGRHVIRLSEEVEVRSRSCVGGPFSPWMRMTCRVLRYNERRKGYHLELRAGRMVCRAEILDALPMVKVEEGVWLTADSEVEFRFPVPPVIVAATPTATEAIVASPLVVQVTPPEPLALPLMIQVKPPEPLVPLIASPALTPTPTPKPVGIRILPRWTLRTGDRVHVKPEVPEEGKGEEEWREFNVGSMVVDWMKSDWSTYELTLVSPQGGSSLHVLTKGVLVVSTSDIPMISVWGAEKKSLGFEVLLYPKDGGGDREDDRGRYQRRGV